MNKKDREWIKSGVKLSVILAFLLSVAFTLALTTDLQRQVNDLKDFRSFELAKYNFTEEECVEYEKFYTKEICQCLGIDIGCSVKYCSNWTVYQSKCTLYCHQTQVKVGEECRNETLNPSECDFEIYNKQKECTNNLLNKCSLQCNNPIDKYGTALCFQSCFYDKMHVCYDNQPNCFSGNYTMIKSVCTPTYRTERGFCATPDEINKIERLC